MRSSVVLPAPFGPSSPVISPSGAANETPSTALHLAVLAERLGEPVDRDHRRGPRRSGHSGGRALFSKCVDAGRRQRRERRVVDERRDEPRPAGVRRHDVAVAARDDVPAVRQRLRDQRRRSAGGVTGSRPPERISTGTSLATGVAASAGASPCGQTSQTASARSRERLRAHVGERARAPPRRDARHVLGAGHRIVQRGVHLLGEIAGDEHAPSRAAARSRRLPRAR